MKSKIELYARRQLESRPVWGAWIEIPSLVVSPPISTGRAPYGACGLKSVNIRKVKCITVSRPVWGAWIEMILP